MIINGMMGTAGPQTWRIGRPNRTSVHAGTAPRVPMAFTLSVIVYSMLRRTQLRVAGGSGLPYHDHVALSPLATRVTRPLLAHKSLVPVFHHNIHPIHAARRLFHLRPCFLDQE